MYRAGKIQFWDRCKNSLQSVKAKNRGNEGDAQKA